MLPRKRRNIIIIAVSSVAFLLLGSIPLSLSVAFATSNNPYAETYYGAFMPKYRRLAGSSKKKVVVIGTSSVAFGLDSALLREELNYAGFDVDVVGYGLYGALGTRLMLETALPSLKEGDTVIFSPEFHSQLLSNYFSSGETFKATGKDTSIWGSLSGEERKQMVLGVPAYLSDINARWAQGGITPEGVYAASSFDENGDMVYPRPENVMPYYYDVNNPIFLDLKLFSDDFVSYVSEYAKTLSSRKVKMYYRFCPLDELGMEADYKSKIADFADQVAAKFGIPLLGNPRTSVMEANWFYDSSFHLNSAGAIKNTLFLSDQLKLEWGSGKKNKTPDPAMPDLPERKKEEVFGDDSDAAYFAYASNGNNLKIVGVKEEHKNKESLILPTHVDGKYIDAIEENALEGCANLRSVKIQENIVLLRDGLFASCPELEGIILTHRAPSELTVGWALLANNPKAKIYVPSSSLSTYKTDYFWGHYAGRILPL